MIYATIALCGNARLALMQKSIISSWISCSMHIGNLVFSMAYFTLKNLAKTIFKEETVAKMHLEFCRSFHITSGKG